MSVNNFFKRRMRRRFRQYPLYYIVIWLYGASITTSIVLWEIPGRHFLLLATATRWVWCMMSAVLCVLMVFTGLLMGFLRATGRFPIGREYEWITEFGGATWLFSLFGRGVSVIALLYGRVDLAVYFEFVPDAIGKLAWSLRQSAWWGLPSVFFDALVAASVPLKSAWPAVIGLFSQWLLKPLIKPSLKESLRHNHSPAEYLARQRQFAAEMKAEVYRQKPKSSVTVLLRALCELEMWKEAERELSHIYTASRMEPDEEKLWRAKINLGLGRFAEVIKSADPREGQDADEFKATLAIACANLGRSEKARQIMQDLAAGKRRHAEWIGDIQFALGDVEAALNYYEQAAKGTRNYRILGGLARSLAALGNDRESAAFFREAVLAAPYVRVRELRELAECYRHLGKERAAKEVEEIADSVR